MISCSSSSLIKLCVVFLLNISWFTTGTAPPLSQLQQRQQQPSSSAALMPTPTPKKPTLELQQGLEAVTASDRTRSTELPVNPATTNSPPTSSTSTLSQTLSSHVNVTDGGHNSDTKPTFSNQPTKPTLSSLSNKRGTISNMKEISLQDSGGSSSSKTFSTSSSLSKKFEDVLFSTRITSTPAHVYNKLNYKTFDKISDIVVGATTRSGDEVSSASAASGNSGGTDSYSGSSTAAEDLSTFSVPEYLDPLSPPSYSTSSSQFIKDGKQAQPEFLPHVLPTSTPEMMASLPEMRDFLRKLSPYENVNPSTQTPPHSTSALSSSGSQIITTTGDDGDDDTEEEQKEFKDEAFPPEETFSSGIIFDKDYSPEEVAEYIFLTGDERGVASTINDLINDGLMLSREETINFLQAVKSHLTELRIRYQEFLIESENAEDTYSIDDGAEISSATLEQNSEKDTAYD